MQNNELNVANNKRKNIIGESTTDSTSALSMKRSRNEGLHQEEKQRAALSAPFPPNSKFSVDSNANPEEYSGIAKEVNKFNGDHNDLLALATEILSDPSAFIATAAEETKTETKTSLLPNTETPSLFLGPEDAKLQETLTETLETYFGYSQYRTGQLQVIKSILQKRRDAAVFWATGSGKSLCYQIPCLHHFYNNRRRRGISVVGVGIIVSPLISLMQDQVAKLNGLISDGATSSSQALLATFLGSGQTDSSMEQRALSGEFPLVYVTPEKLLGGTFLEQLGEFHTRHSKNGGGILLFAIDESHCVSEWGHDFRPEYRHLSLIREQEELKDVPIVALTATAVDRVQKDIVTNLNLSRDVLVSKQSFDRENLIIEVQKKHRGGMQNVLAPLVKTLEKEMAAKTAGSTIVYVPTKSLVDDVTRYLQSKLESNGNNNNNDEETTKTPLVQAYHGGLSPAHRAQVHTDFLVGKTPIICATIAFGMGIDKPDIRRVVHYGPPKSMEEYYQQIGRAGRDGRKAQASLFVADNDFDRYKSDFYIGGLSQEVQKASMNSLEALKRYSLDMETCRRKALLDFFGETPSFGNYCGTCDICQQRKLHPEQVRDLGNQGARVVLHAIYALNEPGISHIERIIKGHVLEHYKYRPGANATAIQNVIETAKRSMGKKRPVAYFREFLAPLVQRGFVSESSKQYNAGGYNRSYTIYKLTNLGTQVLQNPNRSIILPIPQAIREIELEEEKRRQKMLAQLKKSGVKLEKIPKKEIEAGEGEVIQAYSKWTSYLESLKRRGDNDDKIESLTKLENRINEWRMGAAEKTRMAPAAVLAEHVGISVAYAIATLPAGATIERDALWAVGVRSRELDSLVTLLNEWKQEQPKQSIDNDSSENKRMIFPDHNVTAPNGGWEFATYRPNKKTGMAAWESSHQRFVRGEHPQAIAIAPASGKPIQVSTVISHILDGLVLGRPTPMKRLAAAAPASLPNQEEWEVLVLTEATCQQMGMSVVGDPKTSGPDGGTFTMSAFIRPIVGDHVLDIPFADRTQEQRELLSRWYSKTRWYFALRRIGYDPQFEE